MNRLFFLFFCSVVSSVLAQEIYYDGLSGASAKAQWRVGFDCEVHDFKFTELSHHAGVKEAATKAFSRMTKPTVTEPSMDIKTEFDENMKLTLVKPELWQKKIIPVPGSGVDEYSYLTCFIYKDKAPRWELLTVFNEGRESRKKLLTKKDIDGLGLYHATFEVE
ncbi:hypothetical protein OS175_05305 [Marinicella sp. S1101]|uniref:hypothetical protein n=1 Tax=Marinicella marina TaxID=2996016 RepID=UPI002260B01D|nr:hypothetical protein [Marinicella marina]MCX7553286.1 hypothetical protein [Marinicella marina]MDJ1139018.1 hypothetical protein [Marinicella marina]